MTLDIQGLADEAARRRIREDLDQTFVVEAAAGTGKTSELVARILAVLRSGRGSLDRIIAVTFTEKAAGELKLRLRSALEVARSDEQDPSVLSRLERALGELELAHVGTIHGVCGDLLREHPVQAGLDPMFEVASEERSAALLERVFEAWFQRVLDEPPRAIQRVLRARAWQSHWEEGPRALLFRATRDLVEHRDYSRAWMVPETAYTATMQALVDEAEALGALAEGAPSDDYGAKALVSIGEFAERVRARQRVSVESEERDEDWLEAGIRNFAKRSHAYWRWTGSMSRPLGEQDRRAVMARRDAFAQSCRAWLEDADAHLAAEVALALAPVVADYAHAKRRAGLVDYVDLQLMTRDLVREDRPVRAELQERFTHVFVDEYQDTDPLQAEILTLLAGQDPKENDWRTATLTPGKLFVVGDPKQAIYRFRRADLAVYDDAKVSLVSRGAAVLNLSTSFRATPRIQALINRALEPEMGQGERGVQAAYVPLSPHRADRSSQPAVVALPIPEPYSDWGKVTQWAVSESAPEAVGAYVHWLLHESGWTVGDDARAIQSDDICLLFTRMKTGRTDLAGLYAQALESRGVPHVLLGGRTFYARDEVQVVRHALAAIEWPDDRLRVYATLRGPLFAISDDELFAWIAERGLDPFRADEGEGAVADALKTLATLHVLRNRRPVAHSVSALLERCAAHATLAMRPSGLQALANVQRLTDHARRFDRDGGISFRAFVEWLDARSEGGGGHEAPVVEEGAAGVRLMTVHKAKGLEFPVVVLCDPLAPLKHQEPSRHMDPSTGLWAGKLAGAVPADLRQHADEVLAADHAEGIRKLYVAATRAQDLLVVPAVGDMVEQPESWTSPLHSALYPSTPGPGEAAEGCPEFGDDPVSTRPPRASNNRGRRVGPGRQGDVVWWDPTLLKVAPPRVQGVRHHELLDPRGSGAGPVRERFEAWRLEMGQTRERGARPSQRVRSVTAASKIEVSQGVGVSVVETAVNRVDRPRGARFGTLVHAVLADISFGPEAASEDEVQGLVSLHARVLGADEAEQLAAVQAVLGALEHPLVVRARGSEQPRREIAIQHRSVDGALVEGTADLVFCDDDPFGGRRWVVVDYKTDLEFGADESYQMQIELYVRAIAEATGEPTEGVLLGV